MMTYNYVWLSLHPLVAIVMSETKEEVKAVELSICVGKSLGWMDWWWWSFQALTRDLWSVSGINSVLCSQPCLSYWLSKFVLIAALTTFLLLLSWSWNSFFFFSFLFFKSQTHSPPIRLADVWEWLLQPSELSAQVTPSSLLQCGLLVAQLCLTLDADQEDGVVFLLTAVCSASDHIVIHAFQAQLGHVSILEGQCTLLCSFFLLIITEL